MTTKNGEMEKLFNGALESRIEKQTEIFQKQTKNGRPKETELSMVKK